MDSIAIYDRYLPFKSFSKIRDYITSPKIKWRFNEHKVSPLESTDSFQFVHTFYRVLLPKGKQPGVSDDLVYLTPLLKQLNPSLVLKIKANITPRTPEPDKTDFHTDFELKMGHKTAIYYINDNNGYTEFESGEIVKSVANRLVVFDGSQVHRGVSCTDKKIRIVLNLNYFP